MLRRFGDQTLGFLDETVDLSRFTGEFAYQPEVTALSGNQRSPADFLETFPQLSEISLSSHWFHWFSPDLEAYCRCSAGLHSLFC
jgi:hypothetical protein